MSANLPLFQELFSGSPEPSGPLLTGEELKASGMESVLEHTPLEYKEKFIGTIEGFARGYCFTAEDVRALVGDPPEEVHYNCFGSLMRRAAMLKLIVKTPERRKARRASLHSSELAVWRRV